MIIERIHLANGCTIKCVCIGLMLFRYLSCLGAINDINTIGFCSVHVYACIVSVHVYACIVCDALVAICATDGPLGVHEPKWMSHVKRPSDAAHNILALGLPMPFCTTVCLQLPVTMHKYVVNRINGVIRRNGVIYQFFFIVHKANTFSFNQIFLHALWLYSFTQLVLFI